MINFPPWSLFRHFGPQNFIVMPKKGCAIVHHLRGRLTGEINISQREVSKNDEPARDDASGGKTKLRHARDRLGLHGHRNPHEHELNAKAARQRNRSSTSCGVTYVGGAYSSVVLHDLLIYYLGYSPSSKLITRLNRTPNTLQRPLHHFILREWSPPLWKS